MNIDKTAAGFNSSPLYRFILQEGKFKGVEFYFKNVELSHQNTPGVFDIAFGYEIIGGNYRDDGWEEEIKEGWAKEYHKRRQKRSKSAPKEIQTGPRIRSNTEAQMGTRIRSDTEPGI